MAPSSQVHLPAPPSVVPLFLDVLGVTEKNPFPQVPSISDLQALSTSVQACVASAHTRARNAKEGAKAGRELVTKARRKAAEYIPDDRSETSVASGSARKGGIKVKEEPVDRMQKAGSAAPSSSARKDDDRKAQKGKGKLNGSASTPRMDREMSASPAPTEDSEAIGGRGTPLSAGQQKKKRKLTHSLPTDGASPDSLFESGAPSARGNSQRVDSPGVDRPSGTPTGPVIKIKVSQPGAKPRPHSGLLHPQINQSPLASTINFNLPSHTFSTPAAGSPVPWSNPTPATHSHPRSLIPSRQPIPPPPKPGPKRQKDVNSDYSVPKAGAGGVNWVTFWNNIEPYLKEIGEDDLAMLRFRSDDLNLFDMPPLGKHYQDVWDEEERNMPFRDEMPGAGASSSYSSNNAGAGGSSGRGRQRKYIATRDLTEDELYDDGRGLGGLTERIAAAMVEAEMDDEDDAPLALMVKQEEGENAEAGPGPSTTAAINGHAGGGYVNGSGSAPGAVVLANGAGGPVTLSEDEEEEVEEQVDARWPIYPHLIPDLEVGLGERPRLDTMNTSIDDLEAGMKRELAMLGLLEPDQEVDWSAREDDEISAALRHCQRLLRVQLAVNNARKDRLAGIVKDRLAHAEYKRTLDGLEKVIEVSWAKRGSRKSKKGKKSANAAPAPHVPLDETTKKAIATRAKWIHTVGAALETSDVQGRYKGLPEKSIYEGIDPSGKGLVNDEDVLMGSE